MADEYVKRSDALKIADAFLEGDTSYTIRRKLEELPSADARPVVRWISVHERLPERGTPVLTCGVRGGQEVQIYRGSYKDGELWNWKHNTIKQITHWMPLPEPPNCGADMREVGDNDV